jgi:hypothetical protein
MEEQKELLHAIGEFFNEFVLPYRGSAMITFSEDIDTQELAEELEKDLMLYSIICLYITGNLPSDAHTSLIKGLEEWKESYQGSNTQKGAIETIKKTLDEMNIMMTEFVSKMAKGQA